MIPEKLKKYFRENLMVDRDNPILIQKAWRDHLSRKMHQIKKIETQERWRAGWDK